MSQRLPHKVAVVTGAGSGLGRAITELFHAEGAKVLAADISGRESKVADALGEGAISMRVDVASRCQVDAMIERAVEAFEAVHILVNCAGIDGEKSLLGASTDENLEHVLGVNLRGPYWAMRAAIPHMLRAGGGSVVNVSSMAATLSIPSLSAYCASKAALLALTQAAGVEYAQQGIRFNTICPGLMDTPLVRGLPPEMYAGAVAMTPIGRAADPVEVARAVLFLASEDASFITAAAFPVDGAMGAL